MMQKKTLVAGALVLMALAILISLGNWQVRRLAWKTALIEDLAKASISEPAAFRGWLDGQKKFSTVGSRSKYEIEEFALITISGKFLHDQEVFVYTVQQGKPGQMVFVPLVFSRPIDSLRIVMVNRGFVPGPVDGQTVKEIARPSGIVQIRGFARRIDPAGYFALQPDTKKRQWFSNDTISMARHLGYKPDDAPNFYIETDAASTPQGWPKGRDPKQLMGSIPNNHLGYIITWYGLALALLGVYGFFLYGKRQSIGDKE